MSRKPEAVFRDSVHRHCDSGFHHQAVGNSYFTGTPDQYYDGPLRDIWVEYKFWDKIPLHGFNIVDQKKKVCLTPRQQLWINRRWDYGQNSYVIIGYPKGGVILSGCTYDRFWTQAEFLGYVIDRKEIALWLENSTGYRRNV